MGGRGKPAKSERRLTKGAGKLAKTKERERTAKSKGSAARAGGKFAGGARNGARGSANDGHGKTCLTHLECSACGKRFAHDALQNLCTCGKPLLARYDLNRAARTLTLEALEKRPRTMWRYAEVL